MWVGDNSVIVGPATIGRGAIVFQMGNPDRALADFQRATQIAPSAVAYFWLGKTCEAKGDVRSALQAYENAVRLAPAFTSAQDRAVFLRGRLQN